MSKVKQLFDKAGGWKAILNYAKAGVLPYMVAQILLTGKSIKALELMRNGIQLKNKQMVWKYYIGVLRNFNANYSKEKKHRIAHHFYSAYRKEDF